MRIFKALNVFLLWTLCRAWETQIIQPFFFKTVGLGETVDVKCYIYSEARTRVWYKLSSSRRLQLLTSTDSILSHTTTYDTRYVIMPSSDTLRISDMRWEDAGTYYCGVLSLENVKFGGGTVLEVEGESKPVQSVLQGPGYIEAKPGDSVTLSCSFTYRHCPQEHTSVNWVRSGSASRIVSWNLGNTTVACETGDNPEETSSCVHNLTLEDISSPEVGTYVCVVIVCGDTRSGSGSRIELSENVQAHQNPIVMALTAVSAAFGVSVLVLVGVICKMYKKPTKEMDRHHQGPPQDDQAEDVTYARVNAGPRSAPVSEL